MITHGDPKVSKLLAEALEAEKQEWDTLTHGFHSYPAKMHSRVASTVLDSFAGRSAHVLDPFCGSGTVLVEAMVRGLRGTGIDLNPLALRICEVKCDLRDAKSREEFLQLLHNVAETSFERVRTRTKTLSPLGLKERQLFSPHVLLELSGLSKEISSIADKHNRRALGVILSAIVVKFSTRRGDTASSSVSKRIRKGLVTEFFVRKGEELVKRWEQLWKTSSHSAKLPVLLEGDARDAARLVGRSYRAQLILTSPPYGGTYDYVEHHALRYPWLSLDTKRFRAKEIGARRNLREGQGGVARWDIEVKTVLQEIGKVLDPNGLAIILIGDAQIGAQRILASEQFAHLAPHAKLRVVARASHERVDWTHGRPRNEHLIAFESSK